MLENSIIITVVIALSELIKQLGFIPKRFIPLVSLALGIIASFIWSGLGFELALFNGFVIGLSACGLYSGTKNVTQGIKGK